MLQSIELEHNSDHTIVLGIGKNMAAEIFGSESQTIRDGHGYDRIGKQLERGTLVDVLSLFVFEDTGITTAETIVRKALVLSVHKSGVESAVSGGREKQKQMEVTLIVKPKEAEWIVAAMNQGGVDLVVRNDQILV